LAEIDREVIRNAWDAERIDRERAAPRYAFFPAGSRDAAIVNAAGGTLTSRFTVPVTIHQYSPDD
jgi:hypothetical protein